LNPDQVTTDLNATADYGKKLPPQTGNCMFAGSAGRRPNLSVRNKIAAIFLRRSVFFTATAG